MKSNFHINCPVCTNTSFKKLKDYFEKNGLVKCNACGFVFMFKIPSYEDLSNYYSKYSYKNEAYLSPITIKNYNKLLDEFENLRITGNLLDVGCGRGWFLEEAKKRGWNVYGTEFSEMAVEICRNKGIAIKQGDLISEDFENIKFDVITSFEVIEHLSFPRKHIEEVYKLLRQGGLYYCTTPNFNALYRYLKKTNYNIITFPEHLSYFSKSTLCKLAAENSLKKIKFLSTGLSVELFKSNDKLTNLSMNSPEHPDEKLRKEIEKRFYMKGIKFIINSILTLLNKGNTLKGYFIKSH